MVAVESVDEGFDVKHPHTPGSSQRDQRYASPFPRQPLQAKTQDFTFHVSVYMPVLLPASGGQACVCA